MSLLVEVEYPVEVKQYQVSIARDTVRITLEGIEGINVSEPRSDSSSSHLRVVGRITFGDYALISQADFFTRDGVLKMDRPLLMFPGILHLLQHQKPLFLHKDGSLSTALDLVYCSRA